MWSARVAAAAATSATLRTNRALSSGVNDEPREEMPRSEFDGIRFCEPFGPPPPPAETTRSPSPRSVVGEVGLSRRNRDDILSPIRFKKGSSGILSRQFASDADRLMGGCCCGGTKSGP